MNLLLAPHSQAKMEKFRAMTALRKPAWDLSTFALARDITRSCIESSQSKHDPALEGLQVFYSETQVLVLLSGPQKLMGPTRL